MKELFELYMERYSKIEKKSWQYDEREINKFLSQWFNRKISDISKYEIKSLHLKIRENNGLYQANRMLERIRSMFTGARKTNVMEMRWEQIDWHNKTWRIPDTKNGEPIVIPLHEGQNLMSKKALLGVVLPFISNPVVLAAVGISAVGYTVYELFSRKEEEAQGNGTKAVPDGSEPLDEPLNGEDVMVPDTVKEPLNTARATVDELINPAVKEPYVSTFFGDLNNDPQQNEVVSEDASKKEMIRQAMSELGKRSAIARAKKKSTR